MGIGLALKWVCWGHWSRTIQVPETACSSNFQHPLPTRLKYSRCFVDKTEYWNEQHTDTVSFKDTGEQSAPQLLLHTLPEYLYPYSLRKQQFPLDCFQLKSLSLADSSVSLHSKISFLNLHLCPLFSSLCWQIPCRTSRSHKDCRTFIHPVN